MSLAKDVIKITLEKKEEVRKKTPIWSGRYQTRLKMIVMSIKLKKKEINNVYLTFVVSLECNNRYIVVV